jgi:hypothetical protein
MKPDFELPATRRVPGRRGPTGDHWRALRAALERWRAERPFMKAFFVRWDDAACPLSAAACTGIYPIHGGRCVVVDVRSDISPQQTFEAMCHELQHVDDQDHLAAGRSRPWLEWRAETTARRLGVERFT